MISKAIAKIVRTDIEALIQNHVRESRTIEYKQSLPGNSDEEKREFLADISSFANASGGDLLYGIKAVEGVPHDAIGLDCNIDAEKQRLENLQRDCLDPRIPGVRMVTIEGFTRGPVLLIRIPRSWTSPHMITFKNLSRFFTRNSTGKYQMDVTEIRSAFFLAESLPTKIKRFRDERLSKIISDETPVPLFPDSKLVLHVLPVSSFTKESSLDVSVFQNVAVHLKPIGRSNWDNRFNIDGVVSYGIYHPENKSRAYCQIFRTGQIESVETSFTEHFEGKLALRSIAYEGELISAVHQYLLALEKLGISPPIFVLISMLGVSGAYLGVETWRFSTQPAPIDRDILLLPDILIEDYTASNKPEDVAKFLRPAFDAVWNACGYERSFNYDAEGKWNPRS